MATATAASLRPFEIAVQTRSIGAGMSTLRSSLKGLQHDRHACEPSNIHLKTCCGKLSGNQTLLL